MDDVRQGGTGIRFEMRFEVKERRWNEDSWKEDKKRKRDRE